MKQHRPQRTSRISEQAQPQPESISLETPVQARHRAIARSLWACGCIGKDAGFGSSCSTPRASRRGTGAKRLGAVVNAGTIAGRRFLVILLLLLVAESFPAQASDAASTSGDGAAASKETRGAPLNVPLGKTRRVSLPPDASFRVSSGAAIVDAIVVKGALEITSKQVGRAVVVVEAPGHAAQTYLVRVVRAAAMPQTPADATESGVSVMTAAQTAISTTPATSDPAPLGTNPATTPVVVLPTQAVQLPVPAAAPAAPLAVTPNTPSPSTFTLPAPANVVPVPSLPTLNSGISPAFPTDGDGDRISPILPAPSRALPGLAPYPTTSRPNLRNAPKPKGRNVVTVTQGLGRIFSFSSNILSVSFSDTSVMSALPVRARTLAVTGLAPGNATLAVFTESYPGDVIGRSHIYQIAVTPSPSAGGRAFAPAGDASDVQASIRAALGDPRIAVSVISLASGSLTARLTGAVRDKAEADAAIATAGLFVRSVVSGLYVDPTTPTQQAAVVREAEVTTPRENPLAAQLRQVTGNNSIELLPLNGTLVLKATVGSVAEADALLNFLPTLGPAVTPLIVIRGGAGTGQSIVTQPILNAEDAEITRRLQSVTGINSVYVIKVSGDVQKPSEFGLAVYGTVRNRAEYDRVRRYTILLTQTGAVSGGVGPPGTIDTAQRSTLAASGYRQSVGVQLFVRILDNSQNVIRRVTVQSNVVEINRTALRNLGLELGSVSLLSETITQATATSPSVTTRTINPSPNLGSFLGGNGFVGLQGFQNIDPFRVRLNALYTRGNARVLSQPNLTATDGAVAQVLIGGNRPVPQGGVTQGAAVQSVVFRRFGISLTMRPTFTDDDTIILQIHADITNVDPTFSINLSGSIVPGESTRSIDNTLTVRDGDIIVLAGLITNERRQLTSKVPILSSIPFFGKLFQSKRFENNETELAIFLSPRISRTPASQETIAAVERIPALPPLPGAQASSGLVVFGGTGAGG